MTIRIPKAALLGLLALLLAGGGVAAYFVLRTTETCVSSEDGAEVNCDDDLAISQAEYDQQQAEIAAAEAEEAKTQAKADRCEEALTDFQDELEELDSRLAVGLPYDEYSRQVGTIRVAYDQLSVDSLEFDCLDVALPLEDALQDFAKAGSIWGDCIEDFDCDVDSIDPDLQEH